MALKHTKVSAITDGGDPTQVLPSDWNANHIVDSDGLQIVADTSTPTAPAAGFVTAFGQLIAGGALPAYIGPSGAASALQPFLGRNKVGMWMACGNGTSTNLMNIGLLVPTVLGTATGRNVATTNLFTSMRRFGIVSTSAAAGSIVRASTNSPQHWRGNAAGLGGFLFIARWGCSDAATIAGARTFVGLSASQLGNSEASSLVNMVGVGTDAADSNLQLMCNDASGTASKIDLGANFPDHTLSTDMYELALFAAPNGTEIGYEVTRLNTGDVARGTLSTNLPVSTTFLQAQFTRNNNATALAPALDIVSLYIGTDY